MINRNRRLEILSHVQPSVQESKNWRFPKRIAFDRGKKYRISECAKKGAKKGAEKELKKGAERKQIMLELLSEYLIMTQTDLIDKWELTRKQIQTDIKDLKNEGILERKGFNRNGYWIVNKVD